MNFAASPELRASESPCASRRELALVTFAIKPWLSLPAGLGAMVAVIYLLLWYGFPRIRRTHKHRRERAMKHTMPDTLRRRSQILEARRTLKMASSAHAYVRGSTLKFYEWLNDRPGRAVPAGPPVWICGDCHAGNLGPLAAADGSIHVQIRDLDQTVIGNPNHDLIRLALSLASAARGSSTATAISSGE